MRHILLSASLVNILPTIKKNKCAVVTEAHKEYTCAAYAPAKLLQKVNSGSNWRLSSEQVGEAESHSGQIASLVGQNFHSFAHALSASALRGP